MTDDKIRDPRAVDEALEAARFGDASDEQQMTLRDEVLALREKLECAKSRGQQGLSMSTGAMQNQLLNQLLKRR